MTHRAPHETVIELTSHIASIRATETMSQLLQGSTAMSSFWDRWDAFFESVGNVKMPRSLNAQFKKVISKLRDSYTETAIGLCADLTEAAPQGRLVTRALKVELKAASDGTITNSERAEPMLPKIADIVIGSLKDLLEGLPGWIKNLLTLAQEFLKLAAV